MCIFLLVFANLKILQMEFSNVAGSFLALDWIKRIDLAFVSSTNTTGFGYNKTAYLLRKGSMDLNYHTSERAFESK